MTSKKGSLILKIGFSLALLGEIFYMILRVFFPHTIIDIECKLAAHLLNIVFLSEIVSLAFINFILNCVYFGQFTSII